MQCIVLSEGVGIIYIYTRTHQKRKVDLYSIGGYRFETVCPEFFSFCYTLHGQVAPSYDTLRAIVGQCVSLWVDANCCVVYRCDFLLLLIPYCT